MSKIRPVFFVFVFLLFAAGAAAAEKCVKVIPPEVFRFFGDGSVSSVECDDYVYQQVALNDDEIFELIVHKKSFSCAGKSYCDEELFQKWGNSYRHVGTLPGRYEILKSRTGGYLDITVWAMNNQPVVYRWNGTEYKPETFGKTAAPPKNDPWSSLP
jgi:hypothetical protein